MNEDQQNAAISFDDGIYYDDTERQSADIPEGEYLFRILQYKRENVQAKGKMPNHINVKFQLELEDADGKVGKVWDNLRMYQKWVWKYSQIAKSIGHTAADSKQIRIDWSRFEGSEGRLKLSKRDWKKNDGTVEKQNEFDYLLPAVDNSEADF